MKTLHTIKLMAAVVFSLSCTQLFADTTAYSASSPDSNNTSAIDDSTQTGWQQQNANIATQNARTAKQNADTSAENANTAQENANTAAENVNTAAKILTPVPAPKEVVPVPQGYANCFMIQDGWFNGVWVPAHRVCQYSPNKQGVAWIDGYWACMKYKIRDENVGECINWKWKPGRWVNTFDVY